LPLQGERTLDQHGWIIVRGLDLVGSDLVKGNRSSSRAGSEKGTEDG
jgi:hypothetical protein